MKQEKALIRTTGNWTGLSVLIEQSAIKHYSFDFWNTIAYSNPQFKKARTKYISELFNLTNKEEQINLAFALIGDEYNCLMESQSVILSPEALYLKVIKQLKCNEEVDIKKILKEIEFLFLKYPPIIFPEFQSILDKIQNENITISITSNTAFISGSVIKKFLENIGLLNKFKFCLFSDIDNFAKPDKSLFQKVYSNTKVNQPDLNLNEIIHIGDNVIADYHGAKNMGFQAFHLIHSNPYSYPRYALHSINDINKAPFSAQDYSKFKFGDFNIAKKYGTELFEYFKTYHLLNFDEIPQSIIVYSSPYSDITTSSYYMTQVFFELLENYIQLKNDKYTKLKFGKIKRCQTYTEDYGAMNAIQRYNLIKNDTYSFFDKPEENSFCIFIDDISITGTHQRVIENMMRKSNYTNNIVFLYYAKIENSKIKPSFENDLNFAYVNSIEKLVEVIISDSFKNTTRTTKFILCMCDTDINYFIEFILKYEKHEIISHIYTSALLNNYNTIEIYKNNLRTLRSALYKI